MMLIAEMSVKEFVHRFRLDKITFYSLCDALRRLTSLKGTQETPFQVKVLCMLSFFATGSYQRITGLTQHIVQRTTSRYIDQVVEALNHPTVVRKWIKFPKSQQERTRLNLEFQMKFGFPGKIGCVDCTHIAIIKPCESEHLFYNRKGYHSLNVQMVCDSDLKITSVNAKFGGATHDAFIWASSKVETYLRELHQNGEQVWVLGDCGYPLRPWLMTPTLDAVPGSPEAVYTDRHILARNCIERCLELLKSRWRCLLRYRTLHYQPTKAGKIVLACLVLHNMAIERQLPSPAPVELELYEEVLENVNYNNNQNKLILGRAIQSNLLSRL